MSVLQIFRGDDFLDEVLLGRDVMRLGRHTQNDIVLDDRSLSRFHARVERRTEGFVVVDCGAQNGVHVNGERVVGESSLTPGDRITLGRYLAIFDGARAADSKVAPSVDIGIDIDMDTDADDVRAHDPPTTKPIKLPQSLAKRGEPTLVLLFNSMEVSRHPLGTAGLTVGRSKGADVVISLLGLSRKHARITKAKGGFVVEDLGSQNGTWVNNQRIAESQKLQHGDLLNFYDYGVLFLEDGAVGVALPAVGPAPRADDQTEALADMDTHRSPPSIAPPPRSPRATGKSPVPVADSSLSSSTSASSREVSPAGIDELGEGSFLGDEFLELSEPSKPGGMSSVLEGAVLLGAPPDAAAAAQVAGSVTELVERIDVSEGQRGDSLEQLDATSGQQRAFAGLGGYDDGTGKLARDTLLSVSEGGGRGWPRDEELLQGLSNSGDGAIITIEVTLAGKAFTQMPLTVMVTRIGTDGRCELSLPKASGLQPWHLSLLQLGNTVVMYRACRSGKITRGNSELDMALLRDGDVLDLGKVRLKVGTK